MTPHNIDQRLAIIMGGQIVSAPAIRSEIADGKAQITGAFKDEEARELAAKITHAIPGK